jgi:hypothetical protein
MPRAESEFLCTLCFVEGWKRCVCVSVKFVVMFVVCGCVVCGCVCGCVHACMYVNTSISVLSHLRSNNL